ncbi:hypothetical protein F4801DRAFT_530329 [Xylaria longipes]|nr:hypothetical protein F4801DRAFT_530329 [Xylaria longipes]
MNLGFKTSDTKAEIMRGVLHEFGHALGFQHEHSSPRCPLHLNREAIMKSYKGTLPNNISPEKWFDVNFAKLAMSGTIEASCFDEDSVMMYTIWPEWSQKGERIGGKLSLSKTDREMVRKWYPLRAIQPSSMPAPPFQLRSNKRLSMDSTWLTSLPQHDRPSLIDDFRGNKPEFPER